MTKVTFQVRIGDAVEWHGCGVIVDAHHVVTCDHVVRQSLQDIVTHGDSVDDLVGGHVSAFVETTLGQDEHVELEVVSNYPLPTDEPGKYIFDDLCLLKIASPGIVFTSFVELVVGDLPSDAAFRGQGIAVTPGPRPRYVPKPFEGKILSRAHYTQWGFAFEPEELMQSHPGFSGGALQMPGLPRIYGILQGCQSKQVDYFIPATNIAEFAKQNGVATCLFDPAKPFSSMFQPTRFDLTKDMLKLCDRNTQANKFDEAKKTFLDNLFDREGTRLFAFGIGGQQLDLPDLLHHRLGPNGVQSYKEVRRLKLKEPNELQGQYKFSAFKIDLEYDEPDIKELQRFVIDKIAEISTDEGPFLVAQAEENVIIDALQQFDVPVLFIIYCPYRLFDSAMASAWTDCLSRIAARRHQLHPIIAAMIVTLDPGNPDLPPPVDDDFLLLPLLNEINRKDVGPWISRVRPGDFAGHKAILDHIGTKFGESPFRMKELQDALFPDDESQQGVAT